MRLSMIKRRLVGYRCAGETFQNQDLRSALAPNSEWVNCTFDGCLVNIGSFNGSKFIGCTFKGCEMDVAFFQGCTIVSTTFTDCSLEQASFASSDLRDVSFTNCRLAYSSFNGGTCRGIVAFRKCNLHGADLDYLECDPGFPSYEASNLWGAKMAMGCAFWNGSVDLDTAKRFAAMLHRMHPDPALESFAGQQLAVVERLMGEKNG